jgi:hypothetical protein
MLVEAAKEVGYGFKLDHKHIAGIPDLLISAKGVGPAFVEVKIIKGSDIVLLSPLQILVISRLQAAGAVAGVVAARPLDAGNYDLFVCRDMNDRVCRLGNSYARLHKARGGKWPIIDIIQLLRQPVT